VLKEIKELYLRGIKKTNISSRLAISLKATQSIIDKNKDKWIKEVNRELFAKQFNPSIGS
jgi:hypothetical protein